MLYLRLRFFLLEHLQEVRLSWLTCRNTSPDAASPTEMLAAFPINPIMLAAGESVIIEIASFRVSQSSWFQLLQVYSWSYLSILLTYIMLYIKIEKGFSY